MNDVTACIQIRRLKKRIVTSVVFRMSLCWCSSCYSNADTSKFHPFPVPGNFKRDLIRRNLWQRLFLFDLARFDERLLLCLNLLIQFLRRAILRQLLSQLALNGRIDQLGFECGKVIGILRLQCVDGVEDRECLLDLFNNAFLFIVGSNRNKIILDHFGLNPLLTNCAFI